MVYKLDDETVELNEYKKLPLIAKGKNGNVYCYGNSALKIFNDTKNPPISKETASYLASIDTSRILLPRKLLFYEDAFAGYSLKLVQKKSNVKKLINSAKDSLIENIDMLEKDISKISKKKILLSGMTPENVKYNGKLYISDPSKYTLLDLPSSGDLDDNLEKINDFQLYVLLIELFSDELRKVNFTPSSIRRMKQIFALKDSDQKISTYLNDIIDGQGALKEIVKKINR